MSPYDDARFQSEQVIGPIFCTFAAQACTAADKFIGIAAGSSMAQFFKKVKLLEYTVINRTAPDMSASATGDHAIKLHMGTSGTDTGMGSSAALGTVTGISSTLGIAAGVFAVSTLSTNKPLRMAIQLGNDGTAATLAASSYDVYIRYKEAFA